MTADDIVKIATPLAVIAAAVIQQMNANRAVAERADAKRETVAVKEQLAVTTQASETKLESIAKTAESTHVLVNSGMTAALKTGAVALRRVADMTEAPGDTEAATMAENALAEHEAKQKLVDAAAKLPSLAAQQATGTIK